MPKDKDQLDGMILDIYSFENRKLMMLIYLNRNTGKLYDSNFDQLLRIIKTLGAFEGYYADSHKLSKNNNIVYEVNQI